jgi:hypothetical protein
VASWGEGRLHQTAHGAGLNPCQVGACECVLGGGGHEAATAGGGCSRVGMCGLRQMTSDSLWGGTQQGRDIQQLEGFAEAAYMGALG